MFVYIATNEETNVLKIGISVQPDKRIYGLNAVQLAIDFKLHYCKEFNKETAKLLEAKLLGYLRFKYNNTDYKFAGHTETFRLASKEEYLDVVKFSEDYIGNFVSDESKDKEYFAARERYRFNSVDKFLEYMRNYYRYYNHCTDNRISETTLRLIHKYGAAVDFTKLLRDNPYQFSCEDGASKFAKGLIEPLLDNGSEEHF